MAASGMQYTPSRLARQTDPTRREVAAEAGHSAPYLYLLLPRTPMTIPYLFSFPLRINHLQSHRIKIDQFPLPIREQTPIRRVRFPFPSPSPSRHSNHGLDHLRDTHLPTYFETEQNPTDKMMFATPMPQQFVPFTPVRPSPLSPRRANTTPSRPMTTTTAAAPASSPTSPSPSQFSFQPQFQFQFQPTDPSATTSTGTANPSPCPITNTNTQWSPSPSPSTATAFAFSPQQTPTSPSPRTAQPTYAHRYATKISNPLSNQPRSYTASSSPTARSTRRNAFLNRIKQERDAGRFENRGEQLALMEHVAEEKRWGETMRRRAERLAAGGLDLDFEGDVAQDEEQEVELSVEGTVSLSPPISFPSGLSLTFVFSDLDEIALEEYLRQEDAAHMGPWGSDHAAAMNPGQGGGYNGSKDAGSFSDEEYDDIFMDLAQPPSQDMDMSG
ncbi:uncharacterized protein KD926_007174 [Aspergillus affinis]|uniref:uncharacterized protein n=1 Tax=Aspergillus affinis TaxID=1070780 RepID=UPI0022FEFD6D|nr:uncharacterized protein KD926_007174 [Aspergillus affinis]KAI9041220.1 hypothetical protein KD926_007174 [Aspergillus affinis]